MTNIPEPIQFAEMLGEMRTGFARIDGGMNKLISSTAGIKPTIMAAGVYVIGAIIVVMIYILRS